MTTGIGFLHTQVNINSRCMAQSSQCSRFLFRCVFDVYFKTKFSLTFVCRSRRGRQREPVQFCAAARSAHAAAVGWDDTWRGGGRGRVEQRWAWSLASATLTTTPGRIACSVAGGDRVWWRLAQRLVGTCVSVIYLFVEYTESYLLFLNLCRST